MISLNSFCKSVAVKWNLKLFSTTPVVRNDKVKKFNDIPGPRGPFGIGNLYQYMPWIGHYSFDALHESGIDKYKTWGPIVKETMVPGHNVVWLYDPDDIATVLNDTAPDYPQRRSHLALLKYRKDRPHLYKTGGLLPTNGVEWWKLRAEVQKGLSSPKNVRSFLPATDSITKHFVDQQKEGQTDDFLPEISRLNLELVCLLTFDVRLNSFSEEERLPNSRTSGLIDAAEATNSAILPTEQGLQLWRLYNTRTYKKIIKSQTFLENVAIDLISQKMAFYKESQGSDDGQAGKKSLLDEYLQNPELDLHDIVGMACDLLLAGVHTTAYTTSFILYNLAMNEEVQERLFEETVKILPNPDDEITTKILNSEVPYARAVLKESLRLNPVSVGVGRILNKDTVLQGYLVPKDTVVVTQNFISCRLEKYFSEPETFSPERWLNREDKKLINPYLVLPFGHGMRSCIARRLAEQNMLILMLRLVRKYKIQWKGEPNLSVVTKLINQPDQPIKLSFTERPKF